MVLLAGLAIFIEFFRLGTETLGPDEPTYREAALAYFRGDWSVNLEHPFLAKELIGLSLRLVGDTNVGLRLPGAILGVLTGFVLYRLGRALGDRATGVLAAALWWLLPQSPGAVVARVDRLGALEPAMIFLSLLALLAAWHWGRTGRTSWAVAAGAALGLAASAKLPGALAIGGVAVVLAWVPRDRATKARQAIAALGTAVVAFLVPYLPAGSAAPYALTQVVGYQAEHAAEGHAQLVAGRVYLHPPWWSDLWWQHAYLGTTGQLALGAALLGLLLAGRRARRPVVFGLVATALPVLATATSPLKLPHYHLVWLAPALLTAAYGLRLLWHRGRAPRLLAALSGVALATAAVGQLAVVGGLHRTDYAQVDALLRAQGLASGPVVVMGYPDVAQAYLPSATVVTSAPSDGRLPSVIVVDPVVAVRLPPNPLSTLIEAAGPAYAVVHVDRLEVLLRRDVVRPGGLPPEVLALRG